MAYASAADKTSSTQRSTFAALDFGSIATVAGRSEVLRVRMGLGGSFFS